MPQHSVLAVGPFQEFQYISIPCTVHFFNCCPGHYRQSQDSLSRCRFSMQHSCCAEGNNKRNTLYLPQLAQPQVHNASNILMSLIT